MIINTSNRSLLERSKQTWHSVPPYMRCDPPYQGDRVDSFLTILSLRLDYLYTQFLLHTMLVASRENYRERLIETAHEIVNLVLLPARRRELLYSHRAEIEWTVSGNFEMAIKLGIWVADA